MKRQQAHNPATDDNNQPHDEPNYRRPDPAVEIFHCLSLKDLIVPDFDVFWFHLTRQAANRAQHNPSACLAEMYRRRVRERITHFVERGTSLQPIVRPKKRAPLSRSDLGVLSWWSRRNSKPFFCIVIL